MIYRKHLHKCNYMCNAEPYKTLPPVVKEALCAEHSLIAQKLFATNQALAASDCCTKLHARHRANSTLCTLLHFVRCSVPWFTGRRCTSLPLGRALCGRHFFRWFFPTCVRKGGVRDILLAGVEPSPCFSNFLASIVAKKRDPGILDPEFFLAQIRKVEARLGKLAKIRKVETD